MAGCPCKCQYPLRPEVQMGLKLLINKLICHGLIIPCQSSYNTFILPVKKPPEEYHMVQDLRANNETVIPLYATVTNPYTLLTQVPPDATWFTLLDLKVAFFSAFPFTLKDNHGLPLSGQILTLMKLLSISGLSFHKGFGMASTFEERL